jgi:uncharacterized protein YggE
MARIDSSLLVVILIGPSLISQTAAQTVPALLTPSPTVQANGSATITVKPDQAQLDVGVVTNGATAQDASQQNASLSNTVQAALKQVLGAAGTLQTVNYSVYPRYSASPNQPSVIIGYTASNTVRVTTTDLSQVGLLIDASSQAGANSVGGLSFGLQNPEPQVLQALTQATKLATTHAAAIAAGLGAKLGAVISADEGSSYTPLTVAGGATAGVSTPVQTGVVTVYATVTIRMALAQ